MLRRMFKKGYSVVLSVLREMLENLGLAEGENVSLELDRVQQRMIIKPVEQLLAVPGVDADFAREVNEFIEEYRPALDELAK